MSMDIATFGFAIDSSQAVSAAANLDKMSESSRRAADEAVKSRQATEAMNAELKKIVATQQAQIEAYTKATQAQEQYRRGLLDNLRDGANFAMWITGVNGALVLYSASVGGVRLALEGMQKAGSWMTGDYFSKISDGARIAAVQMKGYALETNTSVAATTSFFNAMSKNTASVNTQVQILARLGDIIRGTSAQALEARAALSQIGVNASEYAPGQEDKMFNAAAQALDRYRDGYEKTAQIARIFGRESAELQLSLIQGIKVQTDSEKALELQRETFYRRDIQRNRDIIALEDEKTRKLREQETRSSQYQMGRALAFQGWSGATDDAVRKFQNGTYTFSDSMKADRAFFTMLAELPKGALDSIARLFGGSGPSPMMGEADGRGAAPLTPQQIIQAMQGRLGSLRPMASRGLDVSGGQLNILNDTLSQLPEGGDEWREILIQRNTLSRQVNLQMIQDEQERLKREELLNGQYVERMKETYSGLIKFIQDIGEGSTREGSRQIALLDTQLQILDRRMAEIRSQAEVAYQSAGAQVFGVSGQAATQDAGYALATGRGTQSGVTRAGLAANSLNSAGQAAIFAARRDAILTRYQNAPDSEQMRLELRNHDLEVQAAQMRMALERQGIIQQGDYSGRYDRSRAIDLIGVNVMRGSAGMSQTQRAVATRMGQVGAQYYDMRDDQQFMSRVRGDALSNMRVEGAAASTNRVADLGQEISLQRELTRAAAEGPAAMAAANDRLTAIRESYGKLGYDVKAVTEALKAQRVEVERTNFSQWAEGVQNATAASDRMATAYTKGGNAGLLQGIDNQARNQVRNFEGTPEYELRLQQATLALRQQQGAQDRANWSQRMQNLKDEAQALNLEKNTISASAGAREEIVTREREILRLRKETNGLTEEQIQLLAQYEGQVARIKRENEDWKNMAGSIGQVVSQGWEDALLSARTYGEAAESVLQGVQRVVFRTLIGKPIQNFITSALQSWLSKDVPAMDEQASSAALAAAQQQAASAASASAASFAAMEAVVRTATPEIAGLVLPSTAAKAAIGDLAAAAIEAATAIRQAAAIAGGGGGGGGGFSLGGLGGSAGGGEFDFDGMLDGILGSGGAGVDPYALPGIYAKGAAFHAGNVIPFARGGIVKRPTLFPMQNGMGLMGEAGEEAVMPLTRDDQGRLGVRSNGGGSGAMVQIIDMRSSSAPPIEASQETGPDGMQIIRLIVREEVNLAAREGALDRTMASNFGIARKPLDR